MVDATPELLALVGEEGASGAVSLSDEKIARSTDGDSSPAGSASERRESCPNRPGSLTQNEQLWEPLYAC